MRKDKHAPITDEAESSSSRDKDSEIAKEEARIRSRIEELRLDLDSLDQAEEDDLTRNMIGNLKMLNKMLLKELGEELKHVELQRSEDASLAADQELFIEIEQEVFGTVVYSSYCEAAVSLTGDTDASMEEASSSHDASMEASSSH